jgi:hypothetical protein
MATIDLTASVRPSALPRLPGPHCKATPLAWCPGVEGT